jgi:isoleucyl-tRNA synthetase
MAVSRAYGLPVVNPVRADGHFEDGLDLVGGQFFKHADADLVRDLERRGALFRHLVYEHAYPHCWRCHTPLMYYAMPAWYVRTTQVKDAMLAENERTRWYPETIKSGRFGDWLNNNIDWSLSRTRYWGTPLPVWRNDEDPAHVVCVGSLAELSELTGRDLSDLEPHRPFIDDVTFTLPDVAGTFRREPHVIDAWYDSGAMPFAQWGYPYAPGSVERFNEAYPAQFICEAIDQTRGWFYTLMAIGTLAFGRSSYENVVCVGHIQAEDGRKMSKHLGNILEPIPLMNDHGADALRWFMACSGSPWAARRVGHTVLSEIVRKVLLTYWNTVAFHVLYARTGGWTPADGAAPVAERPLLDRWLASQTQDLVARSPRRWRTTTPSGSVCSCRGSSTTFPTGTVRRSRRRFWNGRTRCTGHPSRHAGRPDAADGAADAVRHRAGVAGRVRRSTAGAARVGAHVVVACPSTGRWCCDGAGRVGPAGPPGG